MTTETGRKQRPRPFAEDWSLPGTPRPPTTIANPLGAAGRPQIATLRPRSVGPRFRRYSVEDLAGAPGVDVRWATVGGSGAGEPCIDLSPDGSEVAFSWDRSGAFEIYTAPLRGDRIIQLTEAGQRSVMPRWSPDGSEVAFLRDEGGDENMQIWLVDRDGLHERRLTRDGGVAHGRHSWSPEGTRLAYEANADGQRFALFVMDVGTGEHRRLTDGREDDYQPRWSSDGTWIVFWSRRDSVRTNADLYLIPASGGEPLKLETRGGIDGESSDPRWSPDGTMLAFTTNVRGRYEIAIAHLGEGEVTRIERLGATPFDDNEPAWRPDGRGLVYRHSQDAEVSVRRVFTISHADEAVADTPGVHHSPRIASDSETVLSVLVEARRPADVIVRAPRSTEPRRITSSLPATIDPEVLVEPAHLRYPGADGAEIPALLYLPHVEAIDASVLPPAVIYVHGGPTAQHFREWDPVPQILANHGYVVLAPNIRGSMGYGRAFQEANRQDWGGKDLEDVVRAAEWLEREGMADGKRIGIYGESYGGYLTLMCLAREPERFVAGVSVVGVASWTTMYESTRGDLQQYLMREFGEPKRDAARFRERSPLTHASKIRSPLLVLQGANDPRVPVGEAQQLVAALEKSGVTHEYHAYPDEGHAIAKRHNKIDARRRALEWFEKHLEPRREAAETEASS